MEGVVKPAMYKYAFLFPGQGSHYVGMAKTFFEESLIARRTFEEADEILGMHLTKLCFEGPITELNRTRNMQPALLTACTAIYRSFVAKTGIIPSFSAGHSLGEYTALVCAGAITFSDAVRMVRRRGELTQEIADQGHGAMSILDRVDPQSIGELCKEYATHNQYVAVSCFNSPNQVAISGHQEAVEKVEKAVLGTGGQSTPLIASPPMHCSLMNAVAEMLHDELQRLQIHQFRYPVLANATAEPYGPFGCVADRLSLQLCQPVRWAESIQYIAERGVTCFVEIGPKSVLGDLIASITPYAQTYSVGHIADKQELYDRHTRFPFQELVSLCIGAIASTPNLCDIENVQAPSDIGAIVTQLRELDSPHDMDGCVDDMIKPLQLLGKALKCKGVPQEKAHGIVEDIIAGYEQYYELRAAVNSIVELGA